MISAMIVLSVFGLRLHLHSPILAGILVCAIYNPNGKNVEFSGKLSVMLSNASVDEKEIVVLGDFNCDYSPDINSKEVNDLKFVTEMHQLQQMICLPTRVTPHSKTILICFIGLRLSLSYMKRIVVLFKHL